MKNFVESTEFSQNLFANSEAGCAEQRRENRNIMAFVVKTVMFCVSGNFPLRGQFENLGNFMKLLQFCIDAGDEGFKKRLPRMSRNAKCTSLMMQNKILRIVSIMIVQKIVTEPYEWFMSVIADKSCDIPGKKIGIILKYIRDKTVCNSFTKFLKIGFLSPESISSRVLPHLSREGVDFKNLLGRAIMMHQW